MKVMEAHKSLAEKRGNKRLPVNIKIKFYLWNPLFWKKLYRGTIKNISEKGMFISSDTRDFPVDCLLEIFLPTRQGELFLPVKVSNIAWRKAADKSSWKGIGVELTNPPEEYLELVERFRSAL
jgi:Tfp pilus assembly protein PilZ